MSYSTQLILASLILIGAAAFVSILAIGKVRVFLRSRRKKK